MRKQRNYNWPLATLLIRTNQAMKYIGIHRIEKIKRCTNAHDNIEQATRRRIWYKNNRGSVTNLRWKPLKSNSCIIKVQTRARVKAAYLLTVVELLRGSRKMLPKQSGTVSLCVRVIMVTLSLTIYIYMYVCVWDSNLHYTCDCV